MTYRSLLKTTRRLRFCAVVLSLLAGAAQAALHQPAELPMQFHSGGHVLRFTPEGVLVAGRDHLLKVNFVGAVAVAPKTAAHSENESESESENVTAPSASKNWNSIMHWKPALQTFQIMFGTERVPLTTL